MVGAYLLLYYPNYAAASYDALRKLVGLLDLQDLRVDVYCGGPLPEVLGLAAALTAASDAPINLEIASYDLHADGWQWARAFTRRCVATYAPALRLTANDCFIDFLSDQPLSQERPVGRLVTFQCCLNEFAGRRSALEKIKAIGASASPGTVFLFLDHEKYRMTTGAMTYLRNGFAAMGFEVIEDCDAPYAFSTPAFDMPPAVRNEFFDGMPILNSDGTWLRGQYRAKTLNLRALALRKV